MTLPVNLGVCCRGGKLIGGKDLCIQIPDEQQSFTNVLEDPSGRYAWNTSIQCVPIGRLCEAIS